jgi:uncharacterized protein YjbI with pentapeptide repeats
MPLRRTGQVGQSSQSFWRAPRRRIRRHAYSAGASRRDWIQILATALPSIVAAIALIFTWRTVDATNGQLQTTQQGQITERYNAAITNLGSPTVDVRLGGIYALQRIMQDSPRDQPTVVAVLCAFVRDHTKTATAKPPATSQPSSAPRQPPTDIQAALTVVSTRNTAHDGSTTVVDFTDADFTGADLAGAKLSDAKLADAKLAGADLSGADLSGADLTDAKLTDANLIAAGLSRAGLSGANLVGARFFNADFTDTDLSFADLAGANLFTTDLAGADLTDAILTGAELTGAGLTGVNLTGVNLTGAILSRAGLSGVNLSGADLAGAIVTDADLSRANLTDADLSRADLTGADLMGANLTGTKKPPNRYRPISYRQHISTINSRELTPVGIVTTGPTGEAPHRRAHRWLVSSGGVPALSRS